MTTEQQSFASFIEDVELIHLADFVEHLTFNEKKFACLFGTDNKLVMRAADCPFKVGDVFILRGEKMQVRRMMITTPFKFYRMEVAKFLE